MGKPISVQWKLAIFFVLCTLGFTGWIFTEGAHRWVIGQMDMAFKDLPPDEQRESPWAWRWLAWANFRANVCEDYQGAAGMYKEFCGLPKDYRTRVWDLIQKTPGRIKFVSKTTPDGAKGWGPLHTYAPEAYYNYLSAIDSHESGAVSGNEAKAYFVLFYTWHIKHSLDKKPHPLFNKYWVKVRQKILNAHVPLDDVPQWDFNAKLALPYKEEA